MDHPVLEAIAQRHREGSNPGQRRDNFKIALAVEGGAMRGVVSAGMLAGLEYLGLLPVFDVIYGTSAGAINAAYFVAGQAAYGASIYYEDINNAQFMTPLRWLAGEPPISLEFLFEHVMTKQKPLNWRRVLDSPIELVPMATSLSQGKAVPLRRAQSRYGLFLSLKASARIPFFAGPPVTVQDEPFLDGGLCAPIPFRAALEAGCTHVLTLLTRPAGVAPRRSGLLMRFAIWNELARYNPLLGKAFLERAGHYAGELDWLRAHTCAPLRSPYVYAVSPQHGEPTIRQFEQRPERLIRGARTAMEAILRVFGHSDTSCAELLFPDRLSPKRRAPLTQNQSATQGALARVSPHR